MLALASFAGVNSSAQDATPPQIEGVGSLDGTLVGVCFNEAVDPATANDPARYTLSAGQVTSATLQSDGMTVALEVTSLPANFTVNVAGVTDLSGNAVTTGASGRILNLTPQDIGAVESPGLALSCGPDAIDVWARGLDIWGFADSGHFVSESRTGDFDIRVQVQKLNAPGNDASAGLMVREDASPGSRNLGVIVYPSQKNWTAAQRVQTDGASSVFPGNWRIGWPAGIDFPNAWLRMKRVGNTFTTYGSTNGTEWVQIGDSVVPATAYPNKVMVGLRTTPTEVTAPGTTAHARYRNYGTFSVAGTINILQQPTNTTALESTTATFSVNAQASGTSSSNLGYQWQKNGIDIPAATGSSYTTPRLTRADNNAKYRVTISLPGGVQVTSEEATLTVQNDSIAPQIVSLASLDGTTIGVCFNELLTEATASDASHYTLPTGGTVSGATLRPDGMTVLLNTAGTTGTNFTLSVNGVTDLAGNSINTTANGAVLGLTPQDVGVVDGAGTAFACAPGSIDVQARGLDIWGAADSGHLVWEQRTGDFDVRVQVQRFTAPAPDANAGLGVRESLEPGSRNVGIVVYANQLNWTATQRAETDGASSVLAGDWRIQWPEGITYSNVWVRLKRAGETFSTYGSTNGVNWIQIGQSLTPATPYPATVYVGLRTTPVEVEVAGSTAVAEYRNYGNYVVSGAAINIRQQPTNAVVLQNATATFSVVADVTGSNAGIDYQWQKNGVDIAGANSASYTTGPLALADNNAKFRVKLSLPGGTVVFSQDATLTVNPDLAAPQVISAAATPNGAIGILFNELLDGTTANDASFYTVSGGTVDSATLLPDGRTVALQVSGATGNNLSLTINGVKDLAGNTVNAALTAQANPLTTVDLGTVEAPAVVAPITAGSLDVVARGLDIWGSADSGHFAYQELTGDFDVKARVERFEAPAVSANAGLMVREDLSPGSRNVQVVVYANQRSWVGAQRVATDGASSVLAGGWQVNWAAGSGYPNAWVRIKRTGETFITYGSFDGQTWTQVGDPSTPSVPYPQTVYVGVRTTPVEVQVPGSSGYAQYRDYGPYSEIVTPQLTVQNVAPSQISVAWPATGTENFVLESSPTLAPGSWTPVVIAPVTEGNTKRVTVPVDAGTRFFRLRR